MNNINKNKTVTFFDFAPLNYGGGCEMNFMRFGNWLKKKGYRIDFVTPSLSFNRIISFLPLVAKYANNISNDDLKNNFGVSNYETFRLFDVIFFTKKYKKIMEMFKKSDIIYSKNEFFEIFILKYIFRVDSCKLVFGFHTPMYYPSIKSIKSKLHNMFYSSKFYFNLMKDSRIRYLVLSENDKEVLSKNAKSEVVVIPNPLNTTKFQRQEYKKNKIFNIYYIGRMNEQKGIDTLVDIINSFSEKQNFKDCNFFFVGTGEQANLLKNISNKHSNCFFLGFKDDVDKCYVDADLVIVPSRAESFCYTVAEAQSCGVPVLCSDIPGPRDIIIPNITGWTVEVGNVEGFVKGIENSYKIWSNNFSFYKKIGELSRKNILDNYEEEKINSKIERFMFK